MHKRSFFTCYRNEDQSLIIYYNNYYQLYNILPNGRPDPNAIARPTILANNVLNVKYSFNTTPLGGRRSSINKTFFLYLNNF